VQKFFLLMPVNQCAAVNYVQVKLLPSKRRSLDAVTFFVVGSEIVYFLLCLLRYAATAFPDQ